MDALVPVDKPHHYSATFKTNINIYQSTQEIYHPSRYNFNKIDPEILNFCLNSVNWFDIINLNYFSYDSCLHLFYLCLYSLFYLTVPRFRIRGNTYPTWYSIELINYIKKKKSLHSRWRQTRDPDIYTEFKKYRALCVRHSRLCHSFYISNIEDSCRRNPKKF